METEEKKKRGGQKGNRNALKYGFYSKAYQEAEQLDFIVAAGVEGIDEEIALLRVEIKKALSGEDDRNLQLLIKAASALEKLFRTRYQFTRAQQQGFTGAVRSVLIDLLQNVGSTVGSAVITKKILG